MADELTPTELVQLNSMLSHKLADLLEHNKRLKKRIADNDIQYQEINVRKKAEYKQVLSEHAKILFQKSQFNIPMNTECYIYHLSHNNGGRLLRGYFGRLVGETATHLTIEIVNKHTQQAYRYVIFKEEITAVKSLYNTEIKTNFERPITRQEIAQGLTIDNSSLKASHAMEERLKEVAGK